MKYKIKTYLLFFTLLLIGCKERDTIESDFLYQKGDTIYIEHTPYIIGLEGFKEHGDKRYWVRTLDCPRETYDSCTFKILESEITKRE